MIRIASDPSAQLLAADLPTATPGGKPGLHHYRVHGLTLAADRAIPRLLPIPAPRGEPVTLTIGAVPRQLAEIQCEDAFFQANDREYLYRESELWSVLVRDGRAAWFEGSERLDEPLFWYLAVSNAAGIAGYQRGHFPLHGSSMGFRSGAVAFVGPSGAGKTSLVAGLVQRGQPMLSDDLCLIQRQGTGYKAGGGAPELYLLNDTADALGLSCNSDLTPAGEKLAFDPGRPAIDEAPMRAIVSLDFDDAGPPRLERLEDAAPLVTLVGAIRLRMGLHRFPPAQRQAAFSLVIDLARKVPVYRFTRPRAFAAFARGADLLIHHFGSSS